MKVRQPKPFTVAIAQDVLDRVLLRVREYRWDAVPDAGGWNCGVGKAYLRELCDYWVHRYDWRTEEARLNRFPQFKATVDGVALHFYHLKAGSPSPTRKSRAILLTHGWPGSVCEFLSVIEPLAYPDKAGGDASIAFDVVVPSLPGYGFSGHPDRPIGPRTIARMFAKLMKDVLGYSDYIAQGGDWGSAVSAWLGYDHAPACRGVHLNMVIVQSSTSAQTVEEKAWRQIMAENQEVEGAYARLQATKPQTLGLGLMDSPVGIAAWIIEKFGAWTDVPRASNNTPDLSRFSFDNLITNIMLYVVNDSFATSLWLYHGFLTLEKSRFFPDGTRCEAPTGVAAFPDPCFPPPPRSRIEQAYNLIHFTPMARGGHFAAFEQPELFVEDVRAFARKLDKASA
jgi:pimeloyl-ACP methyl ester carboxylesterase